MKRTICCVAGKSGGHIIPCLNQALTRIKQDPEQQVLFFSTTSTLDRQIAQNYSCITQHVPLALQNIPYKRWWRFPLFVWSFISSCITTFSYLRKYKPELVMSTGGALSIPVCLIARLMGIPVELYELNVVPGKATKFLSRYASIVHTCFPETKNYLPAVQCVMSPYPLNPRYSTPGRSREIIMSEYGLSEHKKTVLILGGSQGSQTLNTLLPQVLGQVPGASYTIQVVHQAGHNDLYGPQTAYHKAAVDARVIAFHNAIQELYTIADVVICRSGAGSLFETLHFNKKCITIPLEADTTLHQIDNAQSFANNYPDSFVMFKQSEIQNDPQQFITTLDRFLQE